EGCLVHRTEDDHRIALRVDHGIFLQTLPTWRGKKIDYLTFRRVKEDILLWEPATGLLHVRASLDADRNSYLLLFARHLLGNEELVALAGRKPLFTLAPLTYGKFEFGGDGERVAQVTLRSITMRLHGQTGSVMTLSGDDLQQTFARDLDSISLQSGDL